MTDKEAMAMALEALENIIDTIYVNSEMEAIAVKHANIVITALKEALADPMREVQRLGQEIEQEQLISDQINYGMSVTQGGKRIDPMSIYKEPEQEPVAKYLGECSEGSLVQLYDDVKKGTNFYTAPPQRTEEKNI
jgi:hypothetical protein